jgi:hypothetical protein
MKQYKIKNQSQQKWSFLCTFRGAQVWDFDLFDFCTLKGVWHEIFDFKFFS